VIFPESWQFNKIFVKIVPGDLTASLEKIKDAYLQIAPHRPFEFEFIDEQYTALYDAEQRMGSVFTVFATLAIIIACLGLLGLVSFAAAQRTKEIGIRKALGATASHIVVLITKDFTNLMIIAIVIGLPAAYWIMEQWLNDFAYKISIGAQPLVLASLICILIAFGTASYQAIKAALINPAETLRNE
jgi:putative ABC transport system permease protein